MKSINYILLMSISILVLILIVLVGLQGCSNIEGRENATKFPESDQFSEYWYQGKAELTRFDLQQVRYGEIHQGNGVLIFVTEDFLLDEQVKYEQNAPNNEVRSVLKLNFTRKFYTGIYPYSMMTSTFFPIYSDHNHALKISSSSQEWCGHTYMQLNNRKNKFEISLNSYFQSEGDQRFEVDQALLEDEVWAKIRINPDALPVGKIKIIPGMQYLRLMHKELRIESALAQKEEFLDNDLSANPIIRYQIQYHDISRMVTISFEKEFPYEILAWEESYQPLTINSAENGMMVTKARRTHSLLVDYWNKNAVADSVYRYHLGVQ
jgi:hypothetical protein